MEQHDQKTWMQAFEIWKVQNDNYFKRTQALMAAMQLGVIIGLSGYLPQQSKSTSWEYWIVPIVLSILGFLLACAWLGQIKRTRNYVDFATGHLRTIERDIIAIKESAVNIEERSVFLSYFDDEFRAFVKGDAAIIDQFLPSAPGKPPRDKIERGLMNMDKKVACLFIALHLIASLGFCVKLYQQEHLGFPGSLVIGVVFVVLLIGLAFMFGYDRKSIVTQIQGRSGGQARRREQAMIGKGIAVAAVWISMAIAIIGMSKMGIMYRLTTWEQLGVVAVTMLIMGLFALIATGLILWRWDQTQAISKMLKRMGRDYRIPMFDPSDKMSLWKMVKNLLGIRKGEAEDVASKENASDKK